MATASKVHLEASQKPEFYVEGLTEESAKKASELLQENHDKHHIFFNQSGFHVGFLFDLLSSS
jgi:UDP-N-acetyl-D-mannosaminuronic acid transferase (WecB/TagA/CpsF family)